MKTQTIREPGRDYFVEWQASQARLSEMRKRIAKLSADLTGILDNARRWSAVFEWITADDEEVAMAKQETIADIIAWLRRPREGENAYLTVWRDEIADRLEAAHRRERELTKPAENVNSGEASDTAGNCAKLREALVKCQEIALQWHADEIMGVAGSIKKPEARSASEALIDIEFVANAALDAPPRNCDRFATLPDALAAWRDIDPREAGPFDLWLFAPATEGGAE